jgi:hypothetical protein
MTIRCSIIPSAVPLGFLPSSRRFPVRERLTSRPLGGLLADALGALLLFGNAFGWLWIVYAIGI